jgi:hypothetical protein
MGDVVGFPLRVLHLQATSVANRWEAPLRRKVLAETRCGRSMQTPSPRETPKVAQRFGNEQPTG